MYSSLIVADRLNTLLLNDEILKVMTNVDPMSDFVCKFCIFPYQYNISTFTDYLTLVARDPRGKSGFTVLKE